MQGVFFLPVSFFCMPCLDLSHPGLPAHAACLQAANARQAADGAQQRLGQLQDRCAAEEQCQGAQKQHKTVANSLQPQQHNHTALQPHMASACSLPPEQCVGALGVVGRKHTQRGAALQCKNESTVYQECLSRRTADASDRSREMEALGNTCLCHTAITWKMTGLDAALPPSLNRCSAGSPTATAQTAARAAAANPQCSSSVSSIHCSTPSPAIDCRHQSQDRSGRRYWQAACFWRQSEQAGWQIQN